MHVARVLALLPRNVVVAVLRGYRTVISPLYGDVCRYYPSCSAYALGAVQQHGVIKGGSLAVRRVARCHPWAEGGIDDVPESTSHHFHVNRFGFVVDGHAHTGQRKG
ncbi:membrane protein insertion efficiency factor YidD [Gryllotalpicola daejeonensis]